VIARMWQARTADPESYRRVFETEVLAELRDVAGFEGAYLLGREQEIRTVTLFASLTAVRGFAGPDHEREHVSPAARATLIESDPAIRHFEVLSSWLRGA
jgi:hypothetical protein